MTQRGKSVNERISLRRLPSIPDLSGNLSCGLGLSEIGSGTLLLNSIGGDDKSSLSGASEMLSATGLSNLSGMDCCVSGTCKFLSEPGEPGFDKIS